MPRILLGSSATIMIGMLAVATAGAATAQAPERVLANPDATFPEAFSLVRGVRELPTGRLMIADPLGQTLVVADMNNGTADTLGGVGKGPREYGQPDGVFAMPGDSTLLVDLGNGRLTMLGPDGSFGPTTPIARGGGGRGMGPGMMFILPRAVDARGRIYFQTFGAGPGGGLPDSAPVIRWDRSSDTMDTVAMVKLQERDRKESGGPGNRNVQIQPKPLSPEDAWHVAPDGKIAIARASDYHLEWITPGGGVTKSNPVDYKRVRIKQADKEEWAEGLNNGLRISMTVNNGDRQMSMRRGGGGGQWSGPELNTYEWPDHKPPFVANGVWITPEGKAWVERSVTAGDPRSFDVFNADGALEQRITLPADRRLVGFGKGTVYLVRVDDLDLQWLERYGR